MTETLPQTTKHCTVERDGNVVILTMNRPEARNALSPDMLVGLADGFDYIDETPEIRCAILTGAGGHFSSGADLKAMGRPSDSEHVRNRMAESPNLHWKALLRDYRMTKPLIAAVEGYAVAGGTEMLQGTDIRIAGESAKFGISEAKWSLYPMGGSAVRLVRQIPYTVACDLLLTGRHITAAEALDYGLIGYVVPDGSALEKALEIAEMINRNGPLAVQAILRSIHETEGMHEEEAFKPDTANGIPVFLSEDSKEGPRAFAEKRKPNFKNR